MENLLNNPTGTPDQGTPQGQPGSAGAPAAQQNPSAGDGSPANNDGIPNPTDQNGDGKPQDGGTPNQKQDYSQLVNTVGQDAINQMMGQYEQVNQILSDPEQLKNLSKEQVMQLYQARDGLQDKLSTILPVLEQGKNAKIEESVKDINDQGIKDYILGFKDEFDDPEEFGALVEFAKGLLGIAGKAINQPGQGQPNPEGGAPDMKQIMGGQQNPGPDFDVSKALLSTDPAEREKARQFMNGMFNQIEGKK